jgi:hypothetical protein
MLEGAEDVLDEEEDADEEDTLEAAEDAGDEEEGVDVDDDDVQAAEGCGVEGDVTRPSPERQRKKLPPGRGYRRTKSILGAWIYHKNAVAREFIKDFFT